MTPRTPCGQPFEMKCGLRASHPDNPVGTQPAEPGAASSSHLFRGGSASRGRRVAQSESVHLKFSSRGRLEESLLNPHAARATAIPTMRRGSVCRWQRQIKKSCHGNARNRPYGGVARRLSPKGTSFGAFGKAQTALLAPCPPSDFGHSHVRSIWKQSLRLDRTKWWPAGAAPCVARQAVATVAQFARPRPFETRKLQASGAICRS